MYFQNGGKCVSFDKYGGKTSLVKCLHLKKRVKPNFSNLPNSLLTAALNTDLIILSNLDLTFVHRKRVIHKYRLVRAIMGHRGDIEELLSSS